jgi:hypothetical protein
MARVRLGRRERAAKRARLAAEQADKAAQKEEKKLARYWGKAGSALQRLYDQPINRQAAKVLSRGRSRPD